MVRSSIPLPRAQPRDPKHQLSLQTVAYDGVLEAATLCRLTLTQTYKNNNSVGLDVLYKFPTAPSMVFSKITVEFEGKTVKGIVNERKEAREEFEAAKALGELVAYAETDELSKELLTIELGNLGAGQELKTRFEFVLLLNVSFNKFWELALPCGVAERLGLAEHVAQQEPVSVLEIFRISIQQFFFEHCCPRLRRPVQGQGKSLALQPLP
jgi:hypothetical protein